MSRLHLNKLFAIMEVKAKAMFSKNFIIIPIVAIGLTLLMRIVFGSPMEPGTDEQSVYSYVLVMGALTNVIMVGIYCVAASLAEEKEKNTLRTLMTSSVTGMEFFLGSLIPVVVMMVIINYILIPISGVNFGINGLLIYGLVTLITCITSCMIGLIMGIYAKNQISASTITTPVVLVLMMLPMFNSFNDFFEQLSQFLFTGVLSDSINRIAEGTVPILDWKGITVLIIQIILSIILFMFIYKKNGYESK